MKQGAIERTASNSSLSGEELESAREFRRNALKGEGKTGCGMVV